MGTKATNTNLQERRQPGQSVAQQRSGFQESLADVVIGVYQKAFVNLSEYKKEILALREEFKGLKKRGDHQGLHYQCSFLRNAPP